MINKVILVGNLGKDPEIRTLENGTIMANFSIATNENYRDKNGEWQTITEWHNVTVWRRLAESIEKRLFKGSMAYIEGKLTHRKYTDKNGIERYTTEVVANMIRVINKNNALQESGSNIDTTSNFEGIKEMGKEKEIPSTSTAESAEDDLPF